ncbi:MAG: flagellar biosynthesis anti-sigma factor FlgM [Proteobacteria bacterium]|nr:flagellar biosynthesis anti-sigma factor FlgM [Pseudomonadota bacterium]
MSDSNSEQPKPRRRSATSIALDWLAEKLRRSERIKEQLKSGTYAVDSSKVAEAILNKK